MRWNWTVFLSIVIITVSIGFESSDSTSSDGTRIGSPPADSPQHVSAEDNGPVESVSAQLEKLQVKFLPNAYRVCEMAISGGAPEGDAAFQELQDLGVKTVISVDGMRPDVSTAQRYGMRYIHLPHGYDSVPMHRGHELAKALLELPGPIYIHCHHGKHRSPTATVVSCVEAGLIDPAHAESILRTVGTSDRYRGLYASARNARPVEKEVLKNLSVEYREVADVTPLAQAMVGLDHSFERLKKCDDNGWMESIQDIDIAHETVMLREHLEEMLRLNEVITAPEGFLKYLQQSHIAANELDNAVNSKPVMSDTAKASFAAIAENCSNCHRRFRDVSTVSDEAK